MLFRKKTTPIKRNRSKKSKNHVLNVHVTSPRIMFFQSVKTIRKMARKLLVFGIIATLVWFAYKAVINHFTDNPEFKISSVPVTDFSGKPTVVLSKERVWEISEINQEGTIFQVNLGDVEDKLRKRPEVLEVEAERVMPNIIKIKIKERVPVAWLASSELQLAGRNHYRGVLMDANGVTFKCEKEFWHVAKDLPVIEVPDATKELFVLGQQMRHKDAARALDFANSLRVLGPQDWWVDKIVVENFYTLKVICTDGLVATFPMHEHDDRLKKLMLLREQAAQSGKELAWIDLRPKMNNPGGFKGGSYVLPTKPSHPIDPPETQKLDPSTQSILDRD